MANSLDRIDKNIVEGFSEVGIKMKAQDVRAELTQFKNEVKIENKELKDSLDKLNTDIEGAFKDGIIDQAEAIAIEKYINQLNKEKLDVDLKYTTVYNNQFLKDPYKNKLSKSYIELDKAHVVLIKTIRDAIADGKATQEEKILVDEAFKVYGEALSEFSKDIETAIDAIKNQTIEDLEIGTRNLLLKSNVILLKPSGVSKYLFGTYSTAKELKMGNTYTFVWKGKTTSPEGIKAYYSTSGHIGDLKSLESTVNKKVFTAIADFNEINFYHFPNSQEGTSTSSEVEWAMLFNGDVKPPTDGHIPAPEDTVDLIDKSKKAVEDYTNSSIAANNKLIEINTGNSIKNSELETWRKMELQSQKDREYADSLSETLTNTVESLKAKTQKEVDELNSSVDGLQNELSKLPTNVKLSDVEKQSLINSLQIMTMENYDVNYKIKNLTQDVYISLPNKTLLNGLEVSSNKAFNDVKNSIDKALLDSIITTQERDEINQNIDKFKAEILKVNTTLISTYDQINKDRDKSVSDNINEAKKELNTNIDNVSNSVTTLKDRFDVFIKDGVITETEKVALKSQINNIKVFKADMDSRYNSMYSNALISAADKALLLDSKNKYNTSYNDLITSIENAIADDYVTPEESAEVNINFDKFTTATANLTSTIEIVNKNLLDSLNSEVINIAKESANALNIANKTQKLTSFLETTVDGNVIATGALIVGGVNGVNNAGITGAIDSRYGGPNGEDSVRFYAGAKYTDNYKAPYRVTDSGKLYATDAYIKGEIQATSGKFTGEIQATSGKFTGEINATSGVIKNVTAENINATSGKFTGEVQATSGKFTGEIQATSGKFTGEINATSGVIKNVTADNLKVIDGVFTGTANIKSGTISEVTIDKFSLKTGNVSNRLTIGDTAGFIGNDAVSGKDIVIYSGSYNENELDKANFTVNKNGDLKAYNITSNHIEVDGTGIHCSGSSILGLGSGKNYIAMSTNGAESSMANRKTSVLIRSEDEYGGYLVAREIGLRIEMNSPPKVLSTMKPNASISIMGAGISGFGVSTASIDDSNDHFRITDESLIFIYAKKNMNINLPVLENRYEGRQITLKMINRSGSFDLWSGDGGKIYIDNSNSRNPMRFTKWGTSVTVTYCDNLNSWVVTQLTDW